MIEPYDKALTHKLPDFEKLSFRLVHNVTYCARLSNEQLTIEFNTERYYHPSLSTSFQLSGESEKTFRIVREILAPGQAKSDDKVLRETAQEYGFSTNTIALLKNNGSVAMYIDVSLQQVLNFLHTYGNALYNNPELDIEYAAREINLLKGFGIIS